MLTSFTNSQQMKPDVQSISLLGVTRSKAKMYEYGVPEPDHINIVRDPSALMRLTIGILGDYSAQQQSNKQNGTEKDELRKNVLFSAQFFDSYKACDSNYCMERTS